MNPNFVAESEINPCVVGFRQNDSETHLFVARIRIGQDKMMTTAQY